MKTIWLPLTMSVAVALGSGYVFWRAWRQLSYEQDSVELTQPVATPRPVEVDLDDVTLTERSGRDFRFEELDGEVWVASYFFTSCTGSCFKLNQTLQQLQQTPAFESVRFVSITCDPETDSTDVLSQYADRFEADPDRWLFCRGPQQEVEQLAQGAFKLGIAKRTHTDRAVVVDRDGQIRGRFVVTDPGQLAMLKSALLKCVAENDERMLPEKANH